MYEQHFFQMIDWCKTCHRSGLRTFPSLGAPPIFGDGYIENTHTNATCLSSTCQQSCGSDATMLKSLGPYFNTNQFYCMPLLSDWHRYDEVNDVFILHDMLSGYSILNLTTTKTRTLAIVNLYCDVKKKKCGKSIPNHKKMRLCCADQRNTKSEPTLPPHGVEPLIDGC